MRSPLDVCQVEPLFQVFPWFQKSPCVWFEVSEGALILVLKTSQTLTWPALIHFRAPLRVAVEHTGGTGSHKDLPELFPGSDHNWFFYFTFPVFFLYMLLFPKNSAIYIFWQHLHFLPFSICSLCFDSWNAHLCQFPFNFSRPSCEFQPYAICVAWHLPDSLRRKLWSPVWPCICLWGGTCWVFFSSDEDWC